MASFQLFWCHKCMKWSWVVLKPFGGSIRLQKKGAMAVMTSIALNSSTRNFSSPKPNKRKLEMPIINIIYIMFFNGLTNTCQSISVLIRNQFQSLPGLKSQSNTPCPSRCLYEIRDDSLDWSESYLLIPRTKIHFSKSDKDLWWRTIFSNLRQVIHHWLNQMASTYNHYNH